MAISDFFGEVEIFRRVEFCHSRADDGDGAAVGGDGGFMRGGVDAAREPGDDGEAGLGELEGEFLGGVCAVGGGTT